MLEQPFQHLLIQGLGSQSVGGLLGGLCPGFLVDDKGIKDFERCILMVLPKARVF